MRNGSRFGLLVLVLCWIGAACGTKDRTFEEASGSGGTDDPTGGQGGDGGETGGNGGDTSGGSGGSGGSGDVTSCVDVVLSGDDSSGENTSIADDDFRLSCGSGNAPDLTFAWTAPATDYYYFSTSGSSFDTVVAVLEGCDGPELACNDNHHSSPQGTAIARVERDQTVLVVVDGKSGDQGDVVLDITRVTCPSSDVTDQPLPVVFSTVGGPDDHDALASAQDCSQGDASLGGLEKTIRFVAPEDGVYRFSASSEDFSPLLYLHLGAACGGPALQCSRNVPGGHPAEVARWLDAGQAITVIVESDAEGGEFTFDVTKLDTSACANLPLLTNVSDVELTWEDGAQELSSTCSWAGSSAGRAPEHAYAFTVDLPAGASCSIAVESSPPATTVYVLEGTDCRGEELGCETANPEFTFAAPMDNGDYTLVVENQHSFGGTVTYSITTDCTDG